MQATSTQPTGTRTSEVEIMRTVHSKRKEMEHGRWAWLSSQLAKPGLKRARAESQPASNTPGSAVMTTQGPNMMWVCYPQVLHKLALGGRFRPENARCG